MQSSLEYKNKRLIVILTSIAVGMFAFATLLLPPLYDVFCDLTGLNGKIDLSAPAVPAQSVAQVSTENGTNQAASRTLQVQLTTKTDRAIPWIFNSESNGVRMTPGESTLVSFQVTNPTKKAMSGRAIPSVTPAQATQYLRKIECFCFQEQHLAAGETRDMPLKFYFTEDIPENIKEVTLSYTLYAMETDNGSTN